MSRFKKLAKGNDSGFTIVEMVLAVAIAGIMINVMFSVTFTYYASAMRSQEAAFLALESQALLGQVVEDLRLAEGVGTSNLLDDAYAPSGGWQTSDSSNVLVIRSPAVNSDRNIIYSSETGLPYYNEYIYYLEGSTMYKRTLKNPDAPGNAASTTCPEASSSSSCLADRVFSTNVGDLAFTMYDSNNDETTDPLLSRSLKLTVALAKKVFGSTISLSNTTQVTQRNR